MKSRKHLVEEVCTKKQKEKTMQQETNINYCKKKMQWPDKKQQTKKVVTKKQYNKQMEEVGVINAQWKEWRQEACLDK